MKELTYVAGVRRSSVHSPKREGEGKKRNKTTKKKEKKSDRTTSQIMWWEQSVERVHVHVPIILYVKKSCRHFYSSRQKLKLFGRRIRERSVSSQIRIRF